MTTPTPGDDMTDESAGFRHGNRNRRNLYCGPGEEHHVAVTVGPIEHAAAVSGWLADAATAWEAAGHPMPQPGANLAVQRMNEFADERDKLKTRIDEVIRRWPFRAQLAVLLGSDEAAAAHLAALQGDQPAEAASPQAWTQDRSGEASDQAGPT